MNFIGQAKRIEDIDLPRIGHKIGVGEDEIHAVIDVESSGSGFDSKGRPKMLFEPHVFNRMLPPSQRALAVRRGLAYKRWGTKPYPRDSYPRLLKAIRINKSVALQSASWGLGQIMGFNYAAAGYSTAEDMITAFMDDEDNHLEAMIEFIITKGLDDELRRHDWRGFARGYNGSQYAKHNYHGRLERQYRKWSRIKDTPWSPQDAAEEEKSDPRPKIAPKVEKGAPEPSTDWMDAIINFFSNLRR